jgi:hypothetical protein
MFMVNLNNQVLSLLKNLWFLILKLILKKLDYFLILFLKLFRKIISGLQNLHFDSFQFKGLLSESFISFIRSLKIFRKLKDLFFGRFFYGLDFVSFMGSKHKTWGTYDNTTIDTVALEYSLVFITLKRSLRVFLAFFREV